MSHDPTFAVPFMYNLHVYYVQTLVFTFDIGEALFSYSSLAYTFGEYIEMSSATSFVCALGSGT